MNIIIGPKNDLRLLAVSQKIQNSIIIHNYCKIKKYKGIAFIYIPFAKVLDNGFVEGTEVSIDELLLQLGVLTIYYGNSENSNFMKKIASEYHVKIIFKNFN